MTDPDAPDDARQPAPGLSPADPLHGSGQPPAVHQPGYAQPGYVPPGFQQPDYPSPNVHPVPPRSPYVVDRYQQQYAMPMYAAPPPRALSISSMVIGIVSVVFSWLSIFVPFVGAVVPLVGLILGITGLRREPAARGFALTGIWINGIVLALSALLLVAIILLFVLGIAAIPLLGSSTPPNV